MAAELPLLFQALEFAARKHRDQRRKDKNATPYINHPIELAHLLVNEGGVVDTGVIIAAILHDTVEDTRTTIGELEQIFGHAIAGIVAEVTDDKGLDKEVRKDLQVQHAAGLSPEARLVKLADKICNLRDLTGKPPADWSRERKQEYFDWAKRVIDRLRGTHPGLERLFDAEYARRPG